MESKKMPPSSASDEVESGPLPKEMKLESQVEESSIKEDETDSLDFEKVIRIELVFDALERMLDYKDLKSLRLVSKTCEEIILKHKSFIHKTKFTVDESTIDSGVLNHMRFKPKHVEVEQFIAVSLEDSAAHPLPNDFSMMKLNEILGYRVMKDGVFIWSIEEMKPLAVLCEDVHTLKINVRKEFHIQDKFLRSFPSTKDLLASAKSLKTLEIYGLDSDYAEAEDPRVDKPSVAVAQLSIDGPCDRIDKCVKGFKNLTDVRISFTEPDYGSGSYWKTLRKIIRKNICTIESICLDSFYDFLEEEEGPEIFTLLNLAECTFPRLKAFEVSFFSNESRSVQNFISSHLSQLKKVRLSFIPADYYDYSWGNDDSSRDDFPFPKTMHRFLVDLKSKKPTLCINKLPCVIF